MAKADKADKEENEAAEESKGSGSMKLIIIIMVVLLLVVIGVGAALFMMSGDKATDNQTAENGEPVAEEVLAPKVPIYIPLHPAFLANFEDQSSASYLQVDVQVMTYDEAVEEAVKTHMPKIRNDLLWLFGSQKYGELNTVKGKRELGKKAAETVSKVLKDAGAPHSIEAFLFTSFVMQ